MQCVFSETHGRDEIEKTTTTYSRGLAERGCDIVSITNYSIRNIREKF